MSEARDPGSYKGQISGLRWEAEKCPDAEDGDSMKATLGGGAVGFVGGILMGLPPQLRLVAAVVGAALGHVTTKYHVNLDWDPDALRRAPPPDDDNDDDPRPAPPQPL